MKHISCHPVSRYFQQDNAKSHSPQLTKAWLWVKECSTGLTCLQSWPVPHWKCVAYYVQQGKAWNVEQIKSYQTRMGENSTFKDKQPLSRTQRHTIHKVLILTTKQNKKKTHWVFLFRQTKAVQGKKIMDQIHIIFPGHTKTRPAFPHSFCCQTIYITQGDQSLDIFYIIVGQSSVVENL